jgi:hypothetical protein
MTQRKTTRRSFLARVAGGALVLGGPLSLIAGRAVAGQVTDHDPTDPVGQGRGGGTGITDRDSGPGADPAGRGRGTDPSQSRGEGPVTGVTDSDYGTSADPPQRGRGTQLHQRNAQNCREIRNRLATIETQIGQYAPNLQQMEATYNWIAGDMQSGNPRPDLYVQRAQALGIGVPYGSSPEWVMQQLSERIAQHRSQIGPLEEEAAELRQALVNRNCG